LGNYTGAILHYDKALTVDPSDENALNNKGAALYKLGNHTGAIEYFNKALAIDPHDVNALNNKGAALNSLGNHTGTQQANMTNTLTNGLFSMEEKKPFFK
ncbi:MAG: tetratricopeptide repeat protein, partial [Candidatus Nitrosopolaris sp.]